MNFGFPGGSGRIFGFATDLVLNQTAKQIPLIGVGLDQGTYGSTLGSITMRLAQPLSVSFSFDVKDLDTGFTAGAATISAGSTSTSNGGGPTVSASDRLVLLLSVGGTDSVIIPALEWYIA